MRALDLDYMASLVPVLLGYVPLTLFMALVGMACALVLASIMAVERVFRIPVLDHFVRLFISFFRGTPLLVQIFIFYFFIGTVLNLSREFAGVAALAVSSI